MKKEKDIQKLSDDETASIVGGFERRIPSDFSKLFRKSPRSIKYSTYATSEIGQSENSRTESQDQLIK